VVKKIIRPARTKTAKDTINFRVSNVTYNLRKMGFDFQARRVEFSLVSIFVLALVVGVIGGIYGIGGEAIIAPFCVAFLHIPVHTVAGAAMFGTFVTSIAGVAIYSIVPFYNGQPAPPDWLLGILFGIGGFLGMYLGARSQKFIPEKTIQAILATVIFLIAANYILQFFNP